MPWLGLRRFKHERLVGRLGMDDRSGQGERAAVQFPHAGHGEDPEVPHACGRREFEPEAAFQVAPECCSHIRA